MKKCLLGLVAAFFFMGIAAHAQQQFDWSVSHYTAQNIATVSMDKVTSDKDGNIYTLGIFEGTLSLGGGYNQQMTNMQYPNATNGQWELFVTKTRPDSTVVWVKKFDKTTYKFNHIYNAIVPAGIVVDDSFNVYLATAFPGAIDTDPGSGTQILATPDSTLTIAKSVAIIKLDEDGDFVWSKHITRNEFVLFAPYKGAIDVQLQGFDITPSGKLYGYGNLGGSQTATTLTFDPASQNLVKTFSDASNTRTFWFEIDKSTGVFSNTVYSKMNSSGGFQTVRLKLDDDGNKYLFTSFNGGVDISTENKTTQTVSTPRPTTSFVGSVLVKYDSANEIVWSRTITGTKSVFARGIDIDHKGSIYVVGEVQDTATFFDPNNANRDLIVTLTGTVSTANNSFIARYDTAGNLIWTKKLEYGQTNDVNVVTSGIDIDVLGNPYISGQVYGEFNRVGNSYQSYRHGFISKVDTSSDQLWSMRYGTFPFVNGEFVNIPSVHLTSSNHLIVSGLVRGLGNPINASPLQNDTNSVVRQGYQDAFLLKYACADSTTVVINETVCNQYVYHDSTYTQSGTYTFHYWTASGGCDSIVVLNLTVNYIDKPFITVNNFTLGVTSPYAQYQWLKNGVVIANATNATYDVDENAAYTVVVTTTEGCVDTSDAYQVTNVTSVWEHELSQQVTVYPNPVTDKLYIKSPVNVSYYVSNVAGIIVVPVSSYQDGVAFEQLGDGVYFIHILDKEGRLIKVEKVVKK